jgi:ribonuclease Z
MARIIFLGTAAAIPTIGRENTHLVVESDNKLILIDCAGSPAVRFKLADLSILSLTDIILTHFHPDHVSGVPLLLMNMWLKGRKKELKIHGLQHCLSRVDEMLSLYGWENWPSFFPVIFHRLPERENTLVLEEDGLKIESSPVRHLVPTIGLRLSSTKSGASIAYSCDTEPCPSVVDLASGVDVLIHEATGADAGHSSASQAGAIAEEACAKKLVLVHFPPGIEVSQDLVDQARNTFDGEVILAQDFMQLEL